ncbi:MAG: hypothetical protein FWD61_09490 [Phycisphaerales bacterium]|nr:hypothetical protein [Phycisphaerales bacterium]
MARKRKNSEEQLEMKDFAVKPKDIEEIESAIREMKEHKADHLESLRLMKESKAKVLELVRGIGAKPDINGIIRIKVGTKTIKISQGDAQLKIEEENTKNSTDDDPEETVDDGEGPELTDRE